RFRYAAGTGAASRSFRLRLDSAAHFGDPYSPTHRITVNRSGDHLELALADTSAAGDLELLLPLARGLVGTSLVTTRPAGEDGYFMLLLAPGRAAEAPSLRRDLVAVLDVSGSMSGEKLDQAKAALVQLLGTLRPADRFRLAAFSSAVRRYADGSPSRSRARSSPTSRCGPTAWSGTTSSRRVSPTCSPETSWWCSAASGGRAGRRGRGPSP